MGGRLAPHTEHRSLTGSADARRGAPHVSLEETADGLRAEPKARWPAPGCRQCQRRAHRVHKLRSPNGRWSTP